MALSVGTQLGPYEITGLIGAGGMGEVYRARDTRLGRNVAIKVLSSELSARAELRERFEREAQTISTLNHPAICTLYDVGRHENVEYLVMEFLEGETLADRIARGALPLKEALAIAAQIGDGLEAAHRRGIVHRDLKPANVMLIKTDAGRSNVQAKLLDFGLAKLRGGAPDNTPVVVSAARTDVGNLTAVGSVLGTLQYMSPEQLEGKDADARSDIFAFGTVLYEMLTGRKAFEGKSQVSLIAAILEQDPPPVSTLQPVSPRSLDHLVRGCLAKDPAERWQSAADLVKQARWIAEEAARPADSSATRRGLAGRERAIWAIALGVLALALAELAARMFMGTPASSPAQMRFEISPPPNAVFPGANGTPRLAISPDGRTVAYTVNLRDGKPDQLWIRRLDSLHAKPLVVVTEAINENVQQPFWSPDSRFVAFFVDGKLKKVDVSGGVVQTLCDVPGTNYGGAWNHDGTIVFGASATGGLRRISASGGSPSQVTHLEVQETAHLWPRFLPDGRRFLYQALETSGRRAIFVGTLEDPRRTRLFTSLYMADFAPPDQLLFVHEGALVSQRLDLRTLQLQGEPTIVVEGVQSNQGNGRAGFTVSENGVLVYRSGAAGGTGDSQLMWLDRSGKEIQTVATGVSIRGLELSPKGERAAFHLEPVNSAGGGDIWIVDLERGSRSRLTFDSANHNLAPVWSPDGSRIIFGKATGTSWAVYENNANGVGGERRLYESPTPVFPWSVTPDGKTLVVGQQSPATGADLATMPLTETATPSPVVQTPAAQAYAQVSPDGRWLAYASTESGSADVYVQSFPVAGTKYLVSTMGGTQPRWRADGRELFYRQAGSGPGAGAIMSVSIEPVEKGLKIGLPARLFELPIATAAHSTPIFHYAVSQDGKRLLVSRAAAEASATFETPLTVVVNWDAALPR